MWASPQLQRVQTLSPPVPLLLTGMGDRVQWQVFPWKREIQNIPCLATFLSFCERKFTGGQIHGNTGAASGGLSVSKPRGPVANLGWVRRTLPPRTVISVLPAAARLCFVPIFHEYFEYIHLKAEAVCHEIQAMWPSEILFFFLNNVQIFPLACSCVWNTPVLLL